MNAGSRHYGFIRFDGNDYKLKPNVSSAEFPSNSSRFAQLLWLNQNTFAKGYQREKSRIGGAKLK